MEKNIERECAVCGNFYNSDIFGQGRCLHCGWQNGKMSEENENSVIYPNLISLKKAIKLYKEGKPFEPNLDEFLEALYFYSETQFEYKGICYGVIITTFNNQECIEMFEVNGNKSQIFNNKKDFKNNAKIGDAYLKDIWDETASKYWLN